MHKYNEFLPRNGYKIIHDFVVHYEASKDVFEEKALIYTTLREIRKYEVDEFLLNVKNRATRSNMLIFSSSVVSA